ncbi:uncharacterized protein EI90DRAFT_3055878 [Cantharellus anzutake]|uniref:uncharacterized protein n=1 Tax=Cantharellus anzutake TaxID=1750568 RepID=UPI0019068AE6|nr:uncharacterized protein EI90DRAFT_3055878 [Cantharellus anzutake]KAF8331918.1 hypothetical protein EI90DRAFT_3055878 [Cantharellus anzutake]
MSHGSLMEIGESGVLRLAGPCSPGCSEQLSEALSHKGIIAWCCNTVEEQYVPMKKNLEGS